MAVDFKLDFYDVRKCGFYKASTHDPEFGSLTSLIEDFQDFIEGKNLSLTKTYESDEDRDILPTYCYDFIRKDEDSILITWNETPSEDGKVSSVNGNDSVGSVVVNQTDVPEDHIPGYATYFWINTELDIIVSIKPQGIILNGHQNLKMYFSNFLKYLTRFNVLDDEDTTLVLGYSNNNGSSLERLYPKFQSVLKRRQTEKDELVNNVDDIYKIIRKDRLTLQSEIDQKIGEAILNQVMLENNNPGIIEDHIFRVEIDYKPSMNDLVSMLDRTDEVISGDSDLGFMLSGRSSPIWLSRTYEKFDVSLNVERMPGEVIKATELLDEILRVKSNLFEQVH